MINKLRGEVAIVIDGNERLLRPTMDAIVKWEDATKKTTWQLASQLSDRSIMTIDIISIVEASAVDTQRSEIVDEVDREGIVALYKAAFAVIGNALTRGLEVEADAPGEAEAAHLQKVM